MTTATKNTTRLVEAIDYKDCKIDREAGIIREARILGRVSKNGREYSDKALDDAARLYEGVAVMIDHDRKNPGRERGLMESFGEIQNVKRKEDGVYGDLYFLKSHPATPVILESAERFLTKLACLTTPMEAPRARTAKRLSSQ